MSQDQWYVVQTHTHSERKAAEHLARQGFKTYLPRYQKRRRHARRVELVAAPLFPRYLFVAVDKAMQNWWSIKSTIGVSRLICNGDRPAGVADAVVEDLRRREEGGFVSLKPRQRFTLGDKVQILDGVALASCFGLFDGMPDKDRVAVLLDLLGRKVRVVVDDVFVAAA